MRTIHTLITFILFLMVGTAQFAQAKAYPEVVSGCEVSDSKIEELRNRIFSCFKGAPKDGDKCEMYEYSKQTGISGLPTISSKYLAGLICQHLTPVETVDAFYGMFRSHCYDKITANEKCKTPIRNLNIDWDSVAWKKQNPTGDMGKPMILALKNGVLFITVGINWSAGAQLREWAEKNL